MLRAGTDIRTIQALLGHADIDTTAIYLRLVPGQLREDYDAAMPFMPVDPVDLGGSCCPWTVPEYPEWIDVPHDGSKGVLGITACSVTPRVIQHDQVLFLRPL